MKKITLTNGYEATVDLEPQHKYYAIVTHGNPYAIRHVRRPGGKQITQYLHREILGLEPGDPRQVDHINGNTLDNRRENLRICDCTENNCNVPCRSNNTTGYKGVGWRKERGKYRARIKLNGKETHLGYYDDPVIAAIAYDAAARKYHGEFAYLNFPEVTA